MILVLEEILVLFNVINDVSQSHFSLDAQFLDFFGVCDFFAIVELLDSRVKDLHSVSARVGLEVFEK
jgi:hypothetical protein